MNSRNVLFSLIYLCLSAVLLPAQAAMLEDGINGVWSSAEASFGSGGFDDAGMSLGMVIGGRMDIGAIMMVQLRELEGSRAAESVVSIHYAMMALKQEKRMPIGLQLSGAYSFMNVRSEWLDANDLYKQGSGFALSISVFRHFNLSPLWTLEFGLLTGYEKYKYLTAASHSGVVLPGIPATEIRSDLFFGLELGVLMKLRMPQSPVFAFTLMPILDEWAGGWKIRSRLTTTLPSDI